MAILIDETKRVIVQGITGREGRARASLWATHRGHEPQQGFPDVVEGPSHCSGGSDRWCARSPSPALR